MSDLTGKVIAGRYRVDEFIGRGGMAEVYKVWDTRRSTPLAMKVLHADLALDRAFLRRFNREAETLARLQHPNIVRFYGLEQDGEQIFMLMDFIEGKSLKQVIFNANGPLSLEQTLEIMRPLCQALQYAHYEGFVHADVKPGNVMIDKSGRVMLNDFGIARMAQTSTATLGGAGTPAYMSPEQARSEKPLPQSDIYSLGVMLYEMLTGERPFNGEHAKTGGSMDERVRWEQINLPPPSARKLIPSISEALDLVVSRTLAKHASERFGSALELSQALEQAIPMKKDAKPVPSTVQSSAELKGRSAPPTKGDQKPITIGDSRLRLALAGVLIVSLMIALLSSNPGWMSAFTAKTATQQVPTATRTQTTPRVIPSATATPLPSITPLPSPTGTPLIPIVMAKEVSINCRFGPGLGWEAVSALVLGTQAEILGKNAELNYTWWYIQDPLNPVNMCWVAVDVTNTFGNLTTLPVVEPPVAAVTDVTVRANVDFQNSCSQNPVTFMGSIKANGPATVVYEWELSGSTNLTTSPRSVVFESSGTKNVSEPAAISLDCGDYILKFQVTSPNENTAQDRFSIPP